MSRTIHTILKRSHFTLALGAAALVATSGCIQPQPIGFGELEDPNASVDLTGAGGDLVAEDAVLEFAALSVGAAEDDYLEIIIFSEEGEETDRIETEYRSPVGNAATSFSFMHHSEDFFLVTTRTEDWGALILRIDWDGTVSEFARPAVQLWRIDEARDGGIIVAGEYDLVKLDLNGVEIARDTSNQACWTDVIGAPNAYEAPVAADVMGATEAGPVLAVWEIDADNPYTGVGTVATSAIGSNNGGDKILGQDESGALWVTGRNGSVNRSQDGENTWIGRVDELFEGAMMVRAIESAGEDSVYVLNDRGSQVGHLSADGTTEVLFDSRNRVLNDLVVLGAGNAAIGVPPEPK